MTTLTLKQVTGGAEPDYTLGRVSFVYKVLPEYEKPILAINKLLGGTKTGDNKSGSAIFLYCSNRKRDLIPHQPIPLDCVSMYVTDRFDYYLYNRRYPTNLGIDGYPSDLAEDLHT